MRPSCSFAVLRLCSGVLNLVLLFVSHKGVPSSLLQFEFQHKPFQCLCLPLKSRCFARLLDINLEVVVQLSIPVGRLGERLFVSRFSDW